MSILKRLLVFIDVINDLLGKVTSWLIIGIALIISFEIFVRSVLNNPTIWAHETSTYLFGLYFMIGGAYTLRHQAHVNLDVVYKLFPKRGRAILDVITFFIFLLFLGVIIWKGGELALRSLARMEHSQTIFHPPLYPVKIMVVVVSILVFLQGFAKFLRDSAIVITGRERL